MKLTIIPLRSPVSYRILSSEVPWNIWEWMFYSVFDQVDVLYGATKLKINIKAIREIHET